VSKIKLNVSDWKISVDDRSRGRMKVTIKLSKDEAEGFKNWSTHVKPDELPQEEFVKQVFFNGIEYLNLKLQDVAKKIIEDKNLREQLEASGINVQSLQDKMTQQ
jgi:hypothetical protein